MNFNENGRVLIVDDEPTNLRVLVDSLKGNYECLTATDGKTALELARKASPDLILLDIMMPGMDGYEVCRQLKEDKQTQSIPVIFATAMNQMEDEKKGLDLGAADYVVKPFRIPILMRRVRHQILFKKQQDALKLALDENKELLHILCHDLVNPIFAIQNLVTLLDHCPEDKFDHYVRLIDRSCQNSLEVIRMVRSIRKLEDKGELLELETIDLGKALSESLQTLDQRLQDKEIRIDCDPIENCLVEANYTLVLNSILNNVLTNAIKFSYPGGEIRIRLNETSTSVDLSFQDFGVGMDQKVLASVFEIGGVVSRPGTNNEKGTGFGMPLIQKTMQRFDGEVSLESLDEEAHPEQHGTTVTLRFKKASEATN